MADESSAFGDRLERLIGVLTEKQARIDGLLVILAEAQAKTKASFRETEQRFRETDVLIANTFSRIDESPRKNAGPK